MILIIRTLTIKSGNSNKQNLFLKITTNISWRISRGWQDCISSVRAHGRHTQNLIKLHADTEACSRTVTATIGDRDGGRCFSKLPKLTWNSFFVAPPLLIFLAWWFYDSGGIRHLTFWASLLEFKFWLYLLEVCALNKLLNLSVPQCPYL